MFIEINSVLFNPDNIVSVAVAEDGKSLFLLSTSGVSCEVHANDRFDPRAVYDSLKDGDALDR